MLAKMLKILIEGDLQGDIEKIRSAHDINDWETTQKLIHKIKGGAVYVGTVKIKMACQYFEHYWKSGQHEFLEKLYEQVLTVIEQSVEESSHWLTTH